MNKQLHNTEAVRDHQIETISAIVMLGIVLFISAYILYYWEHQFQTQDIKEKGFSSIPTPQFNGPIGEHSQLRVFAQNFLESPNSYQHIETIYIHNKHNFSVRTIFSGKNTHKKEEFFCLKATYSYEGQIINSPTFC